MALAATCACTLLPRRCGLAMARPETRRSVARCRQRLVVHASVATGPPGDDASDSLSASFAKELEKRDMASAAAAEVEHSNEFDGNALLQVIQDRSASLLWLSSSLLDSMMHAASYYA